MQKGFNLKEAFKSQNLRVDRDWQQHEKALSDDYRIRRGKIAPTSDSHSHSNSNNNNSTSFAAVEAPDPRWHSAEKQKRLIHTAPVLAPSRQQSDTNHHSGGRTTEV